MTTAAQTDNNGSLDPNSTAGKLATLRERLAQTHAPMGQEAIENIHAAGKMTARDRVAALLDSGSFVEIDALAKHRSPAPELQRSAPYTDGVVTGYGLIDGRQVCVISQDASIFDGTIGEVTGEKIVKVMDLALRTGCPLVNLVDGAGAREAEGMMTLALASKIFLRHTQASGVVPQIAVVFGNTSGSRVFTPALSDFIVMVDGAEMSLAGESGSAADHFDTTATAHFVAADEAEAIATAQQLVGYLPLNNRAEAPRTIAAVGETAADNVLPTCQQLDSFMPNESDEAYDMREIIARLVDEGDVLEVQAREADSVVVAFGRIGGRVVGFVANQPKVDLGRISPAAAEKAARFIRTCDAFNIPLVSLVDAPGFAPMSGTALVRAASKLVHAYAESTVGKVTVMVRKAVGAAYTAMAPKELGTDVVLAWPSAEISVKDTDGQAAAAGPYDAAGIGLVDIVISPSETRGQLIEALQLLERKSVVLPPKKHGNIAL
ncbi:acyl-CoA carboxylase subunit beta [Corynebacterium ulceribovis]|uniref:acyl-CoA carboxylase subunit beta n=1 Tax=Corynebacterium ulceribovis TaxID=487732 RepID=UPI000360373E|nr:carboxyl transferase domain-containing protein [Corynebacterium ulceribovis]